MNETDEIVTESKPRLGFFIRVLPCILAFYASFCVMVIELVAGRVIAKHVGQSLYTWTSVIGIVLGGITLGNLIGGRLADRFDPRKVVALLFLFAALTCFGIPLFDYLAGSHDALGLSDVKNWPLRIALHVTSVFLLPATALGLIGPVVAKMALDQGRQTGRTVGNVYAWGALGSILGTFVTGFYLIQAMGTMGIIFSVAGVLSLVGLALAPAFVWPFFVGACIFFCVEAQQGPWEWKVGGGSFLVREKPSDEALYTTESQYSFIEIRDRPSDHRRDLILDNLIHAHYVPEDVTDLKYDYEMIYAAATKRFGGDRDKLHALFLGGGGYIFPRFLQARWPGSAIEVAEIDPAVTNADMEAFGLESDNVDVSGSAASEDAISTSDVSPHGDPEDPATTDSAPGASGDAELAGHDPPATRPIEVHHLDARNHVDDLVEKKRSGDGFEPFDFIYGDAFNDYAVPFHLITREFDEKIKEILRPERGIYLINIIDIFASSRFLGAIYNTMRTVFPHVYVFSNTVGGPNTSDDGRDTFIVIGALRELDVSKLGEGPGEVAFEGSQLEPEHLTLLEERSGGMVLTDDYAPVENLLEVVVRQR
jgi:spermidine synthase